MDDLTAKLTAFYDDEAIPKIPFYRIELHVYRSFLTERLGTKRMQLLLRYFDLTVKTCSPYAGPDVIVTLSRVERKSLVYSDSLDVAIQEKDFANLASGRTDMIVCHGLGNLPEKKKKSYRYQLFVITQKDIDEGRRHREAVEVREVH